MVRLFKPNFSALSLYRRQERRGLSCSGHCLTRSTVYSPRARKQVKACYSRLLSSCKKSWGFFSLIVSFYRRFIHLKQGAILCLALISSAVSRLLQRNCGAVLPVPDKHSRPHLPKTTAIFKAYTATCQKFCHCIILQRTTTIKNQENIMFGEGFCNFFYFCSPFLD